MPKGMLRWHLKNRLAMYRVHRGYTLKQLADLIGSKAGTVGGWECDVSLPPEDMIKRLTKVLGCRRTDIFPFD